jgi:hypothetical protein
MTVKAFTVWIIPLDNTFIQKMYSKTSFLVQIKFITKD